MFWDLLFAGVAVIGRSGGRSFYHLFPEPRCWTSTVSCRASVLQNRIQDNLLLFLAAKLAATYFLKILIGNSFTLLRELFFM